MKINNKYFIKDMLVIRQKLNSNPIIIPIHINIYFKINHKINLNKNKLIGEHKIFKN